MFFCFALYTLDGEDRSRVERLFLEYKDKIYAISLSILKNHHDAEEALGQVMMNIVKNSEKFFCVSRNKIDAQIVIYSRNAAISIYRKNKRRRKAEISAIYTWEEDTEELDIADEDFEVERIILDREKADIVRRYILQLPIEYRDVIDLVYGLGYSYKEAAEILSITPNAVAMKLFRAKKKLLELGGDELYEQYK